MSINVIMKSCPFSAMIDRWSVIHVIVVVTVMVCQVFFLKRFFEIKSFTNA